MEVMSDFSRKLGERTAQRVMADPIATAQERHEAMLAYERGRRRKQILVGGFVAGGVLALAIASLAPPGVGTLRPPSPVLEASAGRAPPPASLETQVASIDPIVPEPPPVQTANLADAPAPPPAAEAKPSPLDAREMRELQSRLRSFGFTPGPIDGMPGRLTTAAVMRYQESRNLPQTGEPDRELLDMLRDDRAPQVALPPPPPRPQPRYTTASRQPNPFDRLGRWLDSLVR
jgi:hypothetical protein